MTDWDVALQALEGKDVKDLLSAVGSGGGAAAPAAGGAAAAGAAPEEAKEEAKEEGEFSRTCRAAGTGRPLTTRCREGGVGRGHGLRSLRLSWCRLGQGVVLTPRIPFVLPTLAWICGGISHTRPQGWEALISGILVHGRSFTWNLKMRF
jgi:large subunit ribosomal protein LP1